MRQCCHGTQHWHSGHLSLLEGREEREGKSKGRGGLVEVVDDRSNGKEGEYVCEEGGSGHHLPVISASGGLLQVKVMHAVMTILYCWSWTSSGKAKELRTTLSVLL